MQHLARRATQALSILAIGWLAPAGVAMAEYHYSPQYETCMDKVDLGALKNSQWAACADQELKKVDAALNTHYRKLQQQLEPEQREALKKSQRAWLQYREARCSFEALGPVAPGGAASQSLCMLEMTAQKADYLRDLLP